MVCPKCGGKVLVIDTAGERNNTVYRRRKCTVCGHSFFTKEALVSSEEAKFVLNNKRIKGEINYGS